MNRPHCQLQNLKPPLTLALPIPKTPGDHQTPPDLLSSPRETKPSSVHYATVDDLTNSNPTLPNTKSQIYETKYIKENTPLHPTLAPQNPKGKKWG